jgi:hypothetical protein
MKSVDKNQYEKCHTPVVGHNMREKRLTVSKETYYVSKDKNQYEKCHTPVVNWSTIFFLTLKKIEI